MPFLTLIATAEGGATSLLDSTVVTFIVDAAKQFLGIMTIPPLGTFLTIGILGAVVGLVATIIHTVRGH